MQGWRGSAMGIGIAPRIAIGAGLGLAMGNLAVGVGAGVAIGAGIGAAMMNRR